MNKAFSILFLLFSTLLLTTSCYPSNRYNYHVRYIDRQDNIEHLSNSTVALVQTRNREVIQAYCTAFFITPTILTTADHCIRNNITLEVIPGITITIPQSSSESKIGIVVQYVTNKSFLRSTRLPEGAPMIIVHNSATVLAHNTEHDIAILEINGQNNQRSIHWLGMSSVTPEIGELVYSMGMQFSRPWILTEGIFSQYWIENSVMIRYFATAQIGPGNSGAALINNSGQAIGVASAIVVHRATGASPHLGIHIPIRYVREMYNNWLDGNNNPEEESDDDSWFL